MAARSRRPTIIIPKNTTNEFFKKASYNYDKTGIIETLAYLIGYEGPDETLVGSELLFPEQSATDIKVTDEGKIKIGICKNSFTT